jgi:myo-inositol 2-dehydrogenase/D-chiro-inositol 1-dehydrogenase
MVRRIHEGQIGEILYTRAFANTPLRTGLVRKPEMSELEYQCRNWYYFSWLSGDFIVDNLIHGIDISNWIHGSYPVRAHGMGALSERSPDYGNLFDHLPWQMKSQRGENPYQQHHNDWFNAIRKDLPFDESEYGAKSTLTAIMGRMAAYSGKIVEWETAFNSTLSLAPEVHSMNDTPPVSPDAQGLYAIPIAGKSVAF